MNRRRKRRAVIAGVVGLASLAAVGSASILSPSIVQATSHCGGTERWDVKTLSDAAADPAARVVGYRAKDTTIDRLRDAHRRRVLRQEARPARDRAQRRRASSGLVL